MRDKRGLFFFLKIFLIILVIVVLVVAGAGIYLYNYYTFKTVRMCISDQNPMDTKLNCTSTQFCIDKAKDSGMMDKMTGITDFPDFINVKVQALFENVFVCDTTCRIKSVCSNVAQLGKICQDVNACQFGEKEIKVDLHGKELWQLLNFAKKHPELLKG